MEHIKFYILTLLALSGCSLFQPTENVRFKNPIFYQKLETGSFSQPFDSQLTPTQEQVFFKGELSHTYPCELLENTGNHIIQKCHIHDKHNKITPEYDVYTRYTVVTYVDELDYEFCKILAEISFEGNDFSHIRAYEGYSIRKDLLPNHDCGPTKTWDYRKRRFLD